MALPTVAPKHFAALYHRGKFFLHQGRWQDALDDFDAVVELNPSLGAALASRAVVRDRLGDFADALDDADAAIELEPTWAVAHFLRGLIQTHLRQTDAALDSFNESLRLDDQFPLAYQERGINWTIKGDYDRALDDINRLIEFEPGNAQAYAHRSMLLHLRGDTRPALADYTRALELDPRVLLSGWNQPLADRARNQTTVLLADAIDGLHSRRHAPAPAVVERIATVEKPCPIPVASTEAIVAEPAPLFPTVETIRPVAAEKIAAPPAPSPPEPVKVDEPIPFAPAAVKTPPPETVIAFDTSVDLAIERLLARVPAPVGQVSNLSQPKKPDSESPKPRPNAPIENRPPVRPDPPAKPIDCPLCRHRLPPAEILTGGRFRCGNCNAVFFPSAIAPPATMPQPASKARPAARAARRNDDEPSLLQRWRKPKPLAFTGVATLIMAYVLVPTNLFGDSRFQSVYPAKGEASFEGKTIAGAIVTLHPIDPPNRDFPSAKAIVGADGKFALGAYAADDGAAAGEYKVTIVQFPPPTAKEIRDENYRPRNILPPRYANPETSGLTVKIGPGENRITAFKLKR